MKRKIRNIGMVVGVLAALLAGTAATPAQATSPPTTSPAAYSRVYQSDYHYTCESGFACVAVSYGNGFYIFKFYYYGTYYLSNWYNFGLIRNSQTDGAAMRFYDVNGSQVGCVPPGGQDTYGLLDAIWSIRLTASSC